MCPYVTLVAFVGVLAGAGATVLLAGVQVVRQRHPLAPAVLLHRFTITALACAALTGLGAAQLGRGAHAGERLRSAAGRLAGGGDRLRRLAHAAPPERPRDGDRDA
jgi:hypothetical protein